MYYCEVWSYNITSFVMSLLIRELSLVDWYPFCCLCLVFDSSCNMAMNVPNNPYEELNFMQYHLSTETRA